MQYEIIDSRIRCNYGGRDCEGACIPVWEGNFKLRSYDDKILYFYYSPDLSGVYGVTDADLINGDYGIEWEDMPPWIEFYMPGYTDEQLEDSKYYPILKELEKFVRAAPGRLETKE